MSPSLPTPRGPISCALLSALSTGPAGSLTKEPELRHADPLGGDLQLSLAICYELHYRGFDGVDAEWEWDPALLAVRGRMERRFLTRLRADVDGGTDSTASLRTVSEEPPDGSGASRYLLEHGTWEQMREYFVHRSIYQLKEADPHAWVIPRLQGRAKCALVAVEFDEFGGGIPERMHSLLFEDLMRAADLDWRYLAYLDQVPPLTLATVNLMSLFGLHRGLRGALVGLFAAAETTTPPSARRLVQTLERLHAPPECIRFYAEHVEADAVHEQVLRLDVVGGLLDLEPDLAGDVVFGIRSSELLEARVSERMIDSWSHGRTSLLPTGRPLVEDAAASGR
ncbi:iron-containing redox enzyme family protein [Rhodococcus kronopolitis]|uniref:Iron-containing redox enzyme family protein n=1 Tax=Rhodococcus kronopolitis TaxID=1460226 RepID=A0ABV9FRA3_9NOCA